MRGDPTPESAVMGGTAAAAHAQAATPAARPLRPQAPIQGTAPAQGAPSPPPGSPAFIPFPTPLLPATFLGRRQRFFADMRLADGTHAVAHCANTGSMRGCLLPGAPALLWDSGNPLRRLPLSWKATCIDGIWIGIDTLLPNRLVEAALAAGEFPTLPPALWPDRRREPPLGPDNRADLRLDGPQGTCWVEVKNVTLVEQGQARFPDAVTTRGRRHLELLAERVRAGDRAALIFLLQREDGQRLRPADDIDPAYGRALRQAARVGVEIHALGARVTPLGVQTRGLVPVEL